MNAFSMKKHTEIKAIMILEEKKKHMWFKDTIMVETLLK